MMLRTPGTSRPKNTNHDPRLSNHSSALSRSSSRMRANFPSLSTTARPPKRAIVYRISAPTTEPIVAAITARTKFIVPSPTK